MWFIRHRLTAVTEDCQRCDRWDWQNSQFYFAIQTFFGSVKKPAYAKATAGQARRFVVAFGANAEHASFSLTHLAFNNLLNFLKLGFGFGADCPKFFLER